MKTNRISEKDPSTFRVRNANVLHRANLTPLDRFAIAVANKVGSIGFFIIVFIWTIGWLGWNVFAPDTLKFDPYPAFVLWLLISNMIQLFLTPLLLIGQNLQSRHSEVRAEADFEVNTKAEKEIENMIRHLEKQDELLSKILERLDPKKET